MTPTESALGPRIREARERRLWTQQRLADAVDVNVKTVRNWESGRVKVPRNRMGALKEILGLNNGSGPRISAELRRMIAGLSPDERAWVLAELSQAEHRSR